MATHELEDASEKSEVGCHIISRHRIAVNGVQLYYLRSGTGPHPILCIPGALAPCEWAFASQLEYFGREGSGYTIVAYDPRGYAYSRPPDREFKLQGEEHHSKVDARTVITS